MATTEILLLQHVKTLGGEGDLVSVKSGYARNFLLARNMAMLATKANKKHIAALRKSKEARELRELSDAQVLMDKLSGISLAIVVKTGENGRMFGSVTNKEIAEHLSKFDIIVDRKRILLEHPIKDIGKHKVTIKLHDTKSCDISLDVVSENPINMTK